MKTVAVSGRGNSGKFSWCKVLFCAVICTPKFKSSEIYVITYVLKKTVFIPLEFFSGKISSEMERFKVFRNQRFSVPSTVEEAVIRQF